MKKKKTKKISEATPFLIIFIGCVLAAAFIFRLFIDRLMNIEQGPNIGNAAVISENKKTETTPPVRLIIPKIKIDADIESIGLTPEGAMGSPKKPQDTAWFNLGPVPGEKGSAVISGHYGWKNNIKAAFDNLNILRKGDKIYTEDEKGKITTFIVSAYRTYDQNADASQIFGSSDGKSHLNLITCKGVWSKANKSYSERLVVFADKE